MSRFLDIPPARLEADVLQALLEEYASRDGTDYGARERSLEEKRASLEDQLARGDLKLLYDTRTEHWDLLPAVEAAPLLAAERDEHSS